MCISLHQFQSDVEKYMKLALCNPLRVVDARTGRSWIISKEEDFPKIFRRVWIPNIISRPLKA